MSLERVAAAAGIDVSHLSRVERGQASLSVDSLARLARVLGLTELAKLLAPYARAGRPGPRAPGGRLRCRSAAEEVAKLPENARGRPPGGGRPQNAPRSAYVVPTVARSTVMGATA